MSVTEFAIVGSGWRAEFYLRIAGALPDKFRVTGLLTRNAEKSRRLNGQWNVPGFTDMDSLLRTNPQFVVTSVPWQINPTTIKVLADRDIPVLSETPPAPDIDGLTDLWTYCRQKGARVQVAEQYIFQPLHAARMAVVNSGKLGRVTQAQVSAAHGYHGISLMRRFLGIGCENVAITARSFSAPLTLGPGRDGPPAEEGIEQADQTLAWFDWKDRLGVFDFSGTQYFSWIRSPRVLIRGERGEIVNEEVRWLPDYRTPIQASLLRRDTGHGGNLEGYSHEGYLCGAEWVYRNPVAPARLSDDEIAIASCLEQMGAYARAEGPEFYSLAEASQDHYLAILLDRSAASGLPVSSERQIWAQG